MEEIKIEPYEPGEKRCDTCFALTTDPMVDGSQLITITRKQYDALVLAQKELDALHMGGVDNWEYYSDALREAGFWDDEEDDF